MGYVSLVILIMILTAIIGGTLFGLLRGRNRAILRLGLVILSVVGAILLRNVIVDLILGINVKDGTIKDAIIGLFVVEGANLPQSILNVIVTLVEILIGLVCYFLLFYILRFITWAIVYPICKIWVKKGENKRSLWGMLFGFIQGVIIAFCIVSPLSGLVVQVDDLSKTKVDGKYIFEIPSDVGVSQYHQSGLGSGVTAVGGWYFDLLTTSKTDDGTTVSIHDTVDVVVTLINFSESATKLSSDVNELENPALTEHEHAELLATIGDDLIAIGNDLNSLSDNAKELIDTIIQDVVHMIPEEELPPTVEEILKDFSIQDMNLVGVGEAIKGVSHIIDTAEINDKPEDVAQEDVDLVVHGLSTNPLILETFADQHTEIIDVAKMGLEDEFMDAINNVTDPDVKNNLLTIFGLI